MFIKDDLANWIRTQRTAGYTFTAIAAASKLKESSVRAFCLRNNIYPAAERKIKTPLDSLPFCKHCGKPIFRENGSKFRVFCSSDCSQAYWSKHRNIPNPESSETLICPVCGNSFSAIPAHKRIYCSRSCFLKSRSSTSVTSESKTQSKKIQSSAQKDDIYPSTDNNVPVIQNSPEEASPPKDPNLKYVAAYARVSLDSESLEHSLENQISYYTSLIKSHRDWAFVDVFYDDGISGTSLNRPGLIKLLETCESGMVDMILIKSISRFGRNTLDVLKTIRYLKSLGVDVFFERENTHSSSIDGEIMFTLLSSFAEEESRSISSNVSWSIRNGFSEGKHKITHLYGYHIENRAFTIIPEEAKVVRNIFSLFLQGNSVNHIAALLNEAGVRTRDGLLWKDVKIRRILDNQAYTGDILTQKMYTDNPLSHKKVPNKGVLPQYLLEDHHEPIVPKSVFIEAQELLAKRSMCRNAEMDSPFIRKIFCPYCSHFFSPAYSKSGTIRWVDGGTLPGNVRCRHSTSFRDKDIRSAVASALGQTLSDQEIKENINRITVTGHSAIEISMKDGRLFHTHISRPAPRGRCANKEVNHAGKKSRTR